MEAAQRMREKDISALVVGNRRERLSAVQTFSMPSLTAGISRSCRSPT